MYYSSRFLVQVRVGTNTVMKRKAQRAEVLSIFLILFKLYHIGFESKSLFMCFESCYSFSLSRGAVWHMIYTYNKCLTVLLL